MAINKMEIYGVYENTVFCNTENNFTVFVLRLTRPIKGYPKCKINCVGYIEPNYIGLPLLLNGSLKLENGKADFNFTRAVPYSVTEEDVMTCSSFKGISRDIISTLIQDLGSNIFAWDSIPDLYNKLIKYDGIGPQKAKKIIDGISVYRKQKELYKYCLAFGEKPKIPEEYFGEDPEVILNKIKTQPYTFGKKCKLTFKCCDTIARANGVSSNNSTRIHAIIKHVMERLYSSGDTCSDIKRILDGANWVQKHCSAFPGEDLSQFQIFAELNNMNSIELYSKDKVSYEYFLKYSYESEYNLALSVKRIQQAQTKRIINLDKIVKICENKLNIKYNDIQKSCFEFLNSDGIKIITGGPGTGKTTVINGLIYAYKYLYPNNNIVLMAPTGRASQRMSEVTGRDAGTIHRVLGINSRCEHELFSNYNANYPADLIVIDEVSMLDSEIAAQAFTAFKGGATIILVGDINQLPSVGAGNVLYDIINSGAAQTAHLEVNYRQGNLSTIAENAEKIKEGITDLRSDNTFNAVKCENEEELTERVRSVFSKFYQKEKPFETQVLCAVKDGKNGVVNLNKELQSLCNKNCTLLSNGKYNFKKDDKIIVTQNNYNDMCFNGDIGTVSDKNDSSILFSIDDRTIEYKKSRLDEIHLAYAMSIHKSQGSEYENVIICLPDENSNMLKRRLIYTAITRAKKNVFIFYVGNALNKAIESNNDAKRVTALKDMMAN